jgi:hypothetical protein
MKESINVFGDRPADEIRQALEALPTAELCPIIAARGDNQDQFTRLTDKAVFCMDQHVGTVSQHYKLVQSKDAFSPIIEGLTLSGVTDYRFNIFATPAKAWLGITVGEAADGVRFGFRASTAHDGGHAISFGMRSIRVQHSAVIVEREHVTVWGYRLSCQNGSIMRVPLMSEKYFTVEERVKVQELFSKRMSIVHSGNTTHKLLEVQYLVEGFLLLKNPLSKMIKDAQLTYLEQELAEKFVKRHIGKRMAERVLEEYAREKGETLWDLYNTVTAMASHAPDLKPVTRESLLNKSANLLTAVLVGGEEEAE